MKIFKKALGVVLALVLLLSAIPTINVDAAAKIKLNKSKVTVYLGSTTTLKVTGTSQKVTWTSGDKKIATVNSKGKVTPKKVGKVTITASVSGKKYKCVVTVKKPYINASKKSLSIGGTYTLKLTGTDIKSATSGNTKVATVTKKGVVKAKKAGTTTITLKGKDGKNYKCKITVKNQKHTHSYYWDGDDATRTHKCSGCDYEGVTEYNIGGAWGYYDEDAAAKLLNYINKRRKSTETIDGDFEGSGLKVSYADTLIESATLVSKAKKRAGKVARNMKQKSKADECLAVGYATAKQTFNAWYKSADYSTMLTDPEYNYGGVTCFMFDSDNSGFNLTPIWVLEMSRGEAWSESVF